MLPAIGLNIQHPSGTPATSSHKAPITQLRDGQGREQAFLRGRHANGHQPVPRGCTSGSTGEVPLKCTFHGDGKNQPVRRREVSVKTGASWSLTRCRWECPVGKSLCRTLGRFLQPFRIENRPELPREATVHFWLCAQESSATSEGSRHSELRAALLTQPRAGAPSASTSKRRREDKTGRTSSFTREDVLPRAAARENPEDAITLSAISRSRGGAYCAIPFL